MISSNDFRNGVTIELDNDVWQIIDFQHVKPGKGAAFVRAKMKNGRTGAVVERTFNAGEKVPKAHVDRRVVQFLYESDGLYNIMDSESYEQTTLSPEQLGDAKKYMKENMDFEVLVFQGNVIGVEIPNSVELEVVETAPGARGDTATGGTKTAKMESGCTVRVPLFINIGDVLRIDTRTGTYIERA